MNALRRTRRSTVGILLVATVATWALPLSPANAAPAYRTQHVFVHCTGDSQVGNLAPAPQTWNSTAPEGPTLADGCAHFDDFAVRNSAAPHSSPVFSGVATGNLRDLTFRGYIACSGGTIVNVEVSLQIDGRNVVTRRPVLGWLGFSGNLPPTGACLGSFSVASLGVASEDGNGKQSHQVSLTVDCVTPPPEEPRHCPWVYDSAQAPTGLTFNPTALEHHKLQP